MSKPHVDSSAAPPTAGAPNKANASQPIALKRCPRCNRKSDMLVLVHSNVAQYTPIVQCLLRVFSPGGVEINQAYRCPRCGNEFRDMNLFEALVAPALLVSLVILALIAFLVFIFVVVNR